jgi:hypothetical protein
MQGLYLKFYCIGRIKVLILNAVIININYENLELNL